jgi:transcriptional regulator with XRE-family HTH domain
MSNKLLDWLYDETRNVPNQFTEEVGRLIKEARIEAKMSQEELAKQTYLKQSSISKIEKGAKGFYAEDLIYLSIALNKPILYFFPERFRKLLEGDRDKTLEEELLIHARRLNRSDLRKLIAQARALAELV